MNTNCLNSKLKKSLLQAAHDIRSPLSALNMLVSSLGELSEEKRAVFAAVIKRINVIANELLESGNSLEVSVASATQNSVQNTKASSRRGVSVTSANRLVTEIVTEKRIENLSKSGVTFQTFLDHTESAQSPRISAIVCANELKRIVSNLLNNSVEAGSTRIQVSVRNYGSRQAIVIHDNGQGIPQNILARIKDGEQTTSKMGRNRGYGLGLSHAKSAIEAAGGRFMIQSNVGEGTMIIISLPTIRVDDQGVSTTRAHSAS